MNYNYIHDPMQSNKPKRKKRQKHLEDLPLSDMQAAIEEGIQSLKGRIKHCCRNSYRHLRLAWKLHSIDNEMSLFRAITAEEEASSALILAFKQARYPGADLLDHRDHIQKMAVTPFLNAVNNFLAISKLPAPRVRLRKSKPPRISIILDVGTHVGKQPLFAEPDQPLNFVVRSEEEGKASVYAFKRELEEISSGKGLKDIISYIRQQANVRNQIIYAHDDGCPTVSFKKDVILERLRRVTLLSALTIIILQTPQHQLFAIQCLEAFLRALRKIKEGGYDFSAVEKPIGPMLTVINTDREPPSMQMSYRYSSLTTVNYQFGWLTDFPVPET